jgi:ABC-2 type transport system ATP-binding protein
MTGNSVISVEGLHKSYGSVHAVNGVSLSVRAGEFFGILGPNGAGKTTLIEILEGLRQADSGSVTVLGESPWPRNRKLLPRIGLQTQASAFFTRLTAWEHLETIAALYGASKAAATRTFELVGLADKGDTPVEKLSGGQRQRLAIAAALTHEPELLFLDEPTAALDPEARRNLWGVLRDVKAQGRTIVYTTHHLDEAELLCDRVAIMRDGEVVALDTPISLIRGLGAPTRVLVPNERLPVDVARDLDGVDDATLLGDSTVMTTSSVATVLTAVGRITGIDDVQTRTATLEDVYLELAGTEYHA